MADSIKKLIELFSKFPTVGPRTAGRFVFYLMKLPKEKIDELLDAILELKNKIKFCSFCFNPFQDESNSPLQSDLCSICKNPSRNKQLLCVVEKETDLISIENTKKYNGLYFILGGTVATMRKNDIDNLRVQELLNRVKTQNTFTEIIIATNPTPEGKATFILVERALKEFDLKITRLAQGLPLGGELEYADEETLESALLGRK
ncbi:MAG: recombination protein RecR [Candidatus Staskawiczbacteria bacterium RIFCSPLOWO2_01_FULL_33_9]|uniref:Recombination protein RecR n=1 Tax=Candidatus Staskawiczbacteria bacterium RIFCSPLOWO2_01_FULL_33_9 TaxID=1802211 RepID=A0A1G2I5I6_9BACT|nr:MAG: recombination protein RecR [Candidatus Staskawiczbacteria bacterium RIFCSPLOWO2_01_FULL_33_9]